VSGANWRNDTARTVPGGPEQAERDAATTFEVEIPAIGQWNFDDAKAKKISRPVLNVLGSESGAMYIEGRDLVDSWFPQSEDHVVQGVTHALQIQDPRSVAVAIGDFLRRHPF
jgi:pimeloyl-ACP methyl ester carboxylesterase